MPLCAFVRKTIPHAINSTTTVRMAVARLELTPSIPILARIDVAAAKIAESKMSFLRFAMAQARVTISEVAKAVELHRMGVSRWFKIDDVNMHYIYIIAEAFGWEVNMHFKKKDKPAEPEKTEPLVEK